MLQKLLLSSPSHLEGWQEITLVAQHSGVEAAQCSVGPLPFPNSHRVLDIRLSSREERTGEGERSFSISLFVELNFWSKVSFIHHYFETDFTRKLV